MDIIDAFIILGGIALLLFITLAINNAELVREIRKNDRGQDYKIIDHDNKVHHACFRNCPRPGESIWIGMTMHKVTDLIWSYDSPNPIIAVKPKKS